MSQENMEIVRRWRDGWAKRDVLALLGYINEEAELDFSKLRGRSRASTEDVPK